MSRMRRVPPGADYRGPAATGAKQQAVNATVLPESHSSDRFVRDLRTLIAKGRRFSTLCADPPWKYDNQGTRACTDNHYPTLSVEQIAAEPVVELAAANAHLHLLDHQCLSAAAFSVIEAWGLSTSPASSG